MPIDEQYQKDFTNLTEMTKYCRDIIKQLKKSKKFYIGLTENPEQRLKEHIEKKKMKNMVILCKIPGKYKNKTILLETRLLKRFDINNNLNEIQEGGGGIDDAEYHYIYVLFR